MAFAEDVRFGQYNKNLKTLSQIKFVLIIQRNRRNLEKFNILLFSFSYARQQRVMDYNLNPANFSSVSADRQRKATPTPNIYLHQNHIYLKDGEPNLRRMIINIFGLFPFCWQNIK